MSKWIVKCKNRDKIEIIDIEADDIMLAAGIIDAITEYQTEDIISIAKAKEYTCQACGAKFENYKEFQEHEASCLGLTEVEYNTYLSKKSWVGYCLRAYSDTFSDKNKDKYNRAVDGLLEFERYHNIKLSEYEKIG